MFYYFGRKGQLARRFPSPRFPLVVEPFAGSAAYSLYWKPSNALLIDRDPDVVSLWNRICSMSVDEIMAFPLPELGVKVEDHWYLSAMASKCTRLVYPTKVSKWGVRSFEFARKLAARNLVVGSRFEYRVGDYTDAPDVEATWFIDPPYQQVGGGYRFDRDDIDYDQLRSWCLSRRGQVIVCEQYGANWLPFKPLCSHPGVNNLYSTEVWWSN